MSSHSPFKKIFEIRMKFSTTQTVIGKLSVQVKISHSSIRRVTKFLKLYPYRDSMVKKLYPLDCPKMVKFCKWFLTNYAYNKVGFNNFIFSYKVFHTWCICKLEEQWSVVNRKPACSYWYKALHPGRVGAQCAVFWKRIMGPIFFKETVDSDVYCSLISQFTVLLEPGKCSCSFQQDKAKQHTSNAMKEFSKLFVDDLVIFWQIFTRSM